MATVDVLDLVVRYGSFTAVDGATWSAHAGEVTAVLGPNGAGKTSTIEALEGYRRPASGMVRVLGLDPVADHRRLRSQIGVMLQSGGVYPTLAAKELLRLFASYYTQAESPDRLLERLELVGVARTPWRRLSGGEQQRLSLTLAIVGRPDVAFLDEPTAGVDPSGRLIIRDVIDELRSRGVAVVLTTHELDEAARVADRIVIIDGGRVVADATPAMLLSDGGGRDILFGAPAGIDLTALRAHLGAPIEEVSPGEYRIDAPSTPATVAALTAWLADRDLPLADLRAGRQSLEEVFLRLTGATRRRATERPARGESERVPGEGTESGPGDESTHPITHGSHEEARP